MKIPVSLNGKVKESIETEILNQPIKFKNPTKGVWKNSSFEIIKIAIPKKSEDSGKK